MRISFKQKLSISLMVTALSLVALYAGGMFGYAGYGLVFFASVFMHALLCESLYGMSIFTFLLTAGVAFFISPDKIPVAVYVALLGHYPIFKRLIDNKLRDKIIGACIKALYCTAWVTGGVCILVFIMDMKIPAELPVPIWLIIIGAEAAFLLLDAVHTFFGWLCREKLHDGLFPRH